MYTSTIMFIASSKVTSFYFLTAVFCLFLLSTSAAHAKIASGTPTVATTSTTTVTAVPQPPTVGTHTLTPAQQKRVANLSANISNTLDATSVRLSNILLRIASRVRSMEQEGKEVTSVKTNIENITTQLQTIRTTLHHIDADVAKVTSSEKPQQEWLTLRKTFTDTNINLQQVKQSLQEVLTTIKTEAPKVTPQTQSTTTKHTP